jgi:hypothetical protein
MHVLLQKECILLVYADDLIMVGPDDAGIEQVVNSLGRKFGRMPSYSNQNQVVNQDKDEHHLTIVFTTSQSP